MKSPLFKTGLTALSSLKSQRLPCWQVIRRFASAIAEEPALEPPLLLKMRNDMKEAMKKKDTVRLDVLRAAFTAASNASKDGIPLGSDARIVVMLRKQVKSSKAAAAGFEAAKRMDLKAKEDAQLAILEEYIGSVPTVGDEEVGQAVTKILANLKANGNKLHYGNVMRDLAGRDGVYFNVLLNQENVQKIVQDKLAAEKKKRF